MTCQRNWLYLESIFSAPDIQRQLPAEAKMFATVDKSYKDIMRKVNKVPLAIRAATQPGEITLHLVTITTSVFVSGVQPRLQSWGTRVWVPTPSLRLHPASGHRPSWGCVWVGVTPPAVGVRGYQPRKFCGNLDAKSCILVTTTLVSGLSRTCISEQTTSMSRAESKF